MNAERQELKKNIQAFHNVEEQLKKDSPGKFALMHDGEIIHVFKNREDALMVGRGRFSAGEFSISPKNWGTAREPGDCGSLCHSTGRGVAFVAIISRFGLFETGEWETVVGVHGIEL